MILELFTTVSINRNGVSQFHKASFGWCHQVLQTENKLFTIKVEVFGFFFFFFNLEPKDGIFRGKRTGSGRTERDVQGPQGLLAFQRAMPYVL